MCTEKGFWFVTNGKLGVSKTGYKRLMSLDDPEITFFFSKENQRFMRGRLAGDKDMHQKYERAKKYDAPLYDLDDECFSQPKASASKVPRPDQKRTFAVVRDRFPTVEQQRCIVLSSHSRVLERSLVWWAREIREHWTEMFGVLEPQALFCDELKQRLAK